MYVYSRTLEGVGMHTYIVVTGFARRGHIPHFETRVFQRRIFPQHCAQSKSNVDVLQRRWCCSWHRNEVLGLCHQGVVGWSSQHLRLGRVFEKWHYYEGTYPRNGGSFISWRLVLVLYQELRMLDMVPFCKSDNIFLYSLFEKASCRVANEVTRTSNSMLIPTSTPRRMALHPLQRIWCKLKELQAWNEWPLNYWQSCMCNWITLWGTMLQPCQWPSVHAWPMERQL